MTIKMIESEGFEMESFSKQPMTMIELVFKGAFYKNHRKLSQNTIDEIYAHCENKEELLNEIAKMINECYNALMEDPKGNDEGNAKWEVVSLSPKVETLE
jgi:hypothetical protein